MLPINLTDSDALREFLGRQGISPKKSMGQNFLVAPEVVEATVAAAKEGPQQVTELGPGVGTLTQGLAANNFSIKAIEKDDVFVQLLAKQFPAITIVHDDLKNVDWSWPDKYQIIGNIPYNLSGLIIRRITEMQPAPAQAILLVQREVGQRLLAQPPEMSLMSLALQLWGTGELLLRVPRNCFWPQPEVDSALVLLTPDKTSAPKEREAIMQIAKPLFQQKRKQLGGSLRRILNLSATDIATLLEQIHIDTTARPQELSQQQWRALHQALASSLPEIPLTPR